MHLMTTQLVQLLLKAFWDPSHTNTGIGIDRKYFSRLWVLMLEFVSYDHKYKEYEVTIFALRIPTVRINQLLDNISHLRR